MRNFKAYNSLNQVILLWSANTERQSEITEGIHNTSANFLQGIEDGHPEISPSTLFAIGVIEEEFPEINGSLQNTFVSGVIEDAIEKGAIMMGEDFTTGQTISFGLKCTAIANYNHLGNNDGLNLSFDACF
jgi:myo-inositol-1-phosphate synthase